MADVIRVFDKINLKDVQAHVLIFGDLSALCGNCQEMGLDKSVQKCPKCGHEFKYAAFRNVRANWPKVLKMMAERPSVKIVDFDDYNKGVKAAKAKDFLK